MRRYDPMKSPDPEEWLALDEHERLAMVESYHRRKRIRMPSLEAHATFHVLVENQIAMGDEIPVKRKLKQLMEEGLNRHEAIHAIASTVSNQLFYALKFKRGGPNLPKAYYAALEDLTAESWLNSAKGDDEES